MNLVNLFTQKNYTKIFVLVFLFTLFAAGNIFAQSVTTNLGANTTKLNIGDSVEVNLFVTPQENSPVFTVAANLRYDTEVLDFQDAIFPEVWLPLPENPYKVTDTVNGLIIRTAGYPTGLYERARFVKYIFKAKKEGDTNLRIFTGKAYNKENNDVGVQSTSLDLRIGGQIATGENVKTVLVDLSLNVKGDTAFYKQDDYTFTIYHKKQASNDYAMSKIWVFDDDANMLYSEEKVWSTGYDTTLNFTIPANTLSEGNYRIIGKVRYSDGREETVAQKSIGVLSNGQTWFTKHKNIFMPLFFFVIVVAFMHHLFTEREVYRKLHKILRKNRK